MGVNERREDLRHRKQLSRTDLLSLLCNRVDKLKLYEVSTHCFFGSWFLNGWDQPGGYIHVSNGIWGLDLKMCPSHTYIWDPECQPSSEFNSYRRGIDNLLSNASPYASVIESTSSE